MKSVATILFSIALIITGNQLMDTGNMAYASGETTNREISVDEISASKVAMFNASSFVEPKSIRKLSKSGLDQNVTINTTDGRLTFQMKLNVVVQREMTRLSGGQVLNSVSFYIATNNPKLIGKGRISVYQGDDNENKNPIKVIKLANIDPHLPVRWDGILGSGKAVKPDTAYKAILELWDETGKPIDIKLPVTIESLEPENRSTSIKPPEKSHGQQVSDADNQNISEENYKALIDELLHVKDQAQHVDSKVNIGGSIRYHYSYNFGSKQFERNSSGIRAYLTADSAISKNWHAYGTVEGQYSFENYNDLLKLSRLYVVGDIGKTTLRAGKFSYLMAEGNVYDSSFTGIRYDVGQPVKYTFSYGETDSTKETSVASIRYNDFDYDLEAGVYHYKRDNSNKKNTIWSLGGNYNFSNFSVGAMYLDSNAKTSAEDSDGYVFSFKYGDLKTYRPRTYDFFAKYYNQPSGTYIEHGMNGLSGRMQGFKGYGLGFNYTISKDFVFGMEYYNLKDKADGARGETWWNQLYYYY